MSRRKNLPTGLVPTFLAHWSNTRASKGYELPKEIDRLLQCLSLAIEDYVESEVGAIPLLRYACQRAATEIAQRLRITHWPRTEAIAFVKDFVEWSLRDVFCYPTDAVKKWLTDQVLEWIDSVYTPSSSVDQSREDYDPRCGIIPGDSAHS